MNAEVLSRVNLNLSTLHDNLITEHSEPQWQDLSTLHNNRITEHQWQELLNDINKGLNDIKGLSDILDDGPRADLLRQIDLIQQGLSEHYGTTPRGGTPAALRYKGLELIQVQLRRWHLALLTSSIQEDIGKLPESPKPSSRSSRTAACRQRLGELFRRPRATVRGSTADDDQDQNPDRLQRS